MIEVSILKCGYSAREALVMLLHTDPNLDMLEVEEVYYPYLRLRYRLDIGKGRLGKKLKKYSDCIVDMVSGSTYETRGEPEFHTMNIPGEDMLDIEVPVHKCYDIAHNFTLKQYIEKSKLMTTPEFIIEEENQFYKRFYIVKCRDEEEQEYYIMVDAVDGGISVLDHEKHYKSIAEVKKLAHTDMNE